MNMLANYLPDEDVSLYPVALFLGPEGNKGIARELGNKDCGRDT
jgi:hypothetical protein